MYAALRSATPLPGNDSHDMPPSRLRTGPLHCRATRWSGSLGLISMLYALLDSKRHVAPPSDVRYNSPALPLEQSAFVPAYTIAGSEGATAMWFTRKVV